jgi:hypothetical protein
MAKIQTPTYSTAAVAAMLAAVAANGNVANQALAVSLINHPDMLDNDGNKRSDKAIVAKLRSLAPVEGFTYQRKQPVTKTGEPVTKKLDLVARIAAAAGVDASKLDGMEKSPKDGLTALALAIEAMAA